MCQLVWTLGGLTDFGESLCKSDLLREAVEAVAQTLGDCVVWPREHPLRQLGRLARSHQEPAE